MPEHASDHGTARIAARLPLRVGGHDGAPSALDGLRVIDFTRALAGPQATQILGDFGAEIIKVEMPGRGDDARFAIPEPQLGGESAFFLSLNRNKKSVALDLSTPQGRQVALDLIATADIVVENFTSRVMRGYGLDHASLKERFPRLIYCSISAYGRTGSLSEAAGLDSPITAEAGVAALNALPGEVPVLGGIPFTDITTGNNAAIAILLALQARHRHGMGQQVESAMYDTAVTNLSFRGYEFLASGREPMPSPRQARHGIPRGQFQTADGTIVITGGGDKMFKAFAANVIGRGDWVGDPQLQTPQGRAEQADELLAVINDTLRTAPSAHWSARCKAAGVPCGVLRAVGEALLSDETAERGLVYRVPHPSAGTVPVMANPARLAGTPQRTATAPPMLGQHTVEILGRLPGYDAERIRLLLASGVVQDGAASAIREQDH